LADGKLATVHYLPRFLRVTPGLEAQLEEAVQEMATRLGVPAHECRRLAEIGILQRGIKALNKEQE